MVHIVTATKAREEFAEIINKVMYAGEKFIVKKQGKTAALITPFYKKKPKVKRGKTKKPIDFLLSLATYNLKGGPKDLAKNHDKYAWE